MNTAAVPSKRDLLALTKAIQAEFCTALIESDVGLVQLVSREFLKTVKLMLSKIEGMVLHTAESRALSASNNFSRTHAQAHNASLLVLLVQLKEALQKIPGQVQAAGADAASSVLLSSSGASQGSGGSAAAATATTDTIKHHQHQNQQQHQEVRDIERAVALAAQWIEELAQRQILEPTVAIISGHVTAALVLMHKEGVVGALPGSNTSAGAASPAVGAGTPSASAAGSSGGGGYTGKAPVSALQEASLECSAAVQSLLKHLPAILKIHLFSLPKCDSVSRATEEVYVRMPHFQLQYYLDVVIQQSYNLNIYCMLFILVQVRTMHSYVTVAALLRPVTESLRLRTAKDMAALEQLLSSLYSLPRPNDCPVLREFR